MKLSFSLSLIGLLMIAANANASNQLLCDAKIRDLPKHLIVGHGINEDRQQAKQNALQSILEQYQVNIQTETEVSGKQANGTSEESFRLNVKSQTKGKLSDAIDVCSYTDEQGLHNLFVSWDSRPPINQLASKLIEHWGGKASAITFSGSKNIVASAPLVKLENLLVARGSVRPEKTVGVSLEYFNNQWLLSADGVSQALPESDLLSYVNLNEGDVEFTLLKWNDGQLNPASSLRQGSFFKFSAQLSGARYYQLFNLYADGRVSAVEGLTPNSNDKAVFPVSGFMKAELLEEGKADSDIYVLVYSDKKFRVSGISALERGKGLITKQGNYSLDSFLAWLDNNSSVVKTAMFNVKTEPETSGTTY
ncbi:LPP20 family lipoprotein [Paraferrimonas sp. SM1919]|uniref:LPP20 family lipoprotein n=1 Tax=Paraferrimonas sp. SM1919 TaxID=2662263 RepID=UPI0013D6D98D|nr:LPP20 family lipoprotein [Paraferrimonas sp. SM1919]